jgi:site-specific DNA recombinase
MTEPFDNGVSFFLLHLQVLPDLERNVIVERMQQGADRAARAGKWIGKTR